MLYDSKVLSVVEKWATCSDPPVEEELEGTKIKCDTSDSETERTSSEGEHSDKTHSSNCDPNMPKIERTIANNIVIGESSDDNKTDNLRSDEESGDTLESDTSEDTQKKSQATAEIASLAQNLLDSWKDLKVFFYCHFFLYYCVSVMLKMTD